MKETIYEPQLNMLRIDYRTGGDQLGASFLFSSIIITSILSDEMRDENSSSRELVFKYDRHATEFIKFCAYNKTSFALAMYKGGFIGSNMIFNSTDFSRCILCIFLRRWIC